jgi:methyltransferase (TIGR00027 family)
LRYQVTQESSAEKVAMLRAIGSLERDPCIRNPDFLAREFLADSRLYRLMIRAAALRPVQACGRWGFERLGPGAYWMEIARVRHFDEILLREVSRGVSQVVLLGAGLDSRPYRFAPELDGIRTIEVDHPGMAGHKRARVEDIFGGLPPGISYLSLDLATSDLGEGLAESGFDPLLPVVVLWIGVSMYLNPDAVSSVLRWLAARPAGSSIGFDYLGLAFFEDERKFRAPRRTRRTIERSGERLGFGLDHAALPSYLHEHGLGVRSHLVREDIEQRYLRRGNGKPAGRSMAHAAFVHAAVPEPAHPG